MSDFMTQYVIQGAVGINRRTRRKDDDQTGFAYSKARDPGYNATCQLGGLGGQYHTNGSAGIGDAQKVRNIGEAAGRDRFQPSSDRRQFRRRFDFQPRKLRSWWTYQSEKPQE